MLALIETAEALGLDAMSAGVVLAWLTEARERRHGARGRAGSAARLRRGEGISGGDGRGWSGQSRGLGGRPGAARGRLPRATAATSTCSSPETRSPATTPATARCSATSSAPATRTSTPPATRSTRRSPAPARPSSSRRSSRRSRSAACSPASTPACSHGRSTATGRSCARRWAASVSSGATSDLTRLGRDTLRLKHRLKLAMGFSLEDVRLPGRFFQTPTPAGYLDRGGARAGDRPLSRGGREAARREARRDAASSRPRSCRIG